MNILSKPPYVFTRSKLFPSSFRFLDLPIEIRFMIYEYYYGNLRIEATCDGYIIETNGIPDLQIERTSQLIRNEAAKVRRSLSSTFTISSREEAQVAAHTSRYSTLLSRLLLVSLPEQLRLNVTKLSFDTEDLHDAMLYWDPVLFLLPRLQNIEVRLHMNPISGRRLKDHLIESFLSGEIDRIEREEIEEYKLDSLLSLIQNPYYRCSKITVDIVYILEIGFRLTLNWSQREEIQHARIKKPNPLPNALSSDKNFSGQTTWIRIVGRNESRLDQILNSTMA